MHAPGVTWRPLVQISGRREFNEVFLEEVRVPVEQTVGPVNGGWPLIRGALAHERGTLWAFDFKIRLQNGALALADLYRTAARRRRRSRRRICARYATQVAQACIESEIFAAHTLRLLPEAARGRRRRRRGAPEAVRQRDPAARLRAVAARWKVPTRSSASASRAPSTAGEWQERYLYSRSVTISSGTSEVLRSLVAQQALGLPRA